MTAGRKLLIVAGGLAAGLVLAEVVLQLASWILPPRMDVLRRSPPVIPDTRLGRRPNPDYGDHDSNGYRNDSVPAEAFVVALGDSQTYGTGVERAENWPHRLEERIGKPVYAISCGGWGPTQSLLLVDRALAFRPRLIVEAFYTGNDLFDSFETVYGDHQLSSLATTDASAVEAIRDAEKTDPLEKRFQRLYNLAFGGDPPEDPAPAGPPPRRSVRDVLREKSKLYRLASIIRQALRRRPPDDWETLKSDARSGPGAEYEIVFESGNLRTIFTPVYRASALDLGDPRLAEGERISRQALEQLSARVRAADVDFFVLLIPTKELVFRSRAGEILADNVSYRELTEREEAVRAGVVAFLRERDIPFVDALPALRNAVERNIQPYQESADGHPNPAGHRVLADVVAAEMERLGLSSKPSAR